MNGTQHFQNADTVLNETFEQTSSLNVHDSVNGGYFQQASQSLLTFDDISLFFPFDARVKERLSGTDHESLLHPIHSWSADLDSAVLQTLPGCFGGNNLPPGSIAGPPEKPSDGLHPPQHNQKSRERELGSRARSRISRIASKSKPLRATCLMTSEAHTCPVCGSFSGDVNSLRLVMLGECRYAEIDCQKGTFTLPSTASLLHVTGLQSSFQHTQRS